jgi:hypothetical protein
MGVFLVFFEGLLVFGSWNWWLFGGFLGVLLTICPHSIEFLMMRPNQYPKSPQN